MKNIYEKKDNIPVIVGRGDNGELVSFASEKKLLNKHVSIFGETGTGKSTLGISLALQRAQSGERVLMFNWHSCLQPDYIMPEQLTVYQEAAQKINVEKEGIALPLLEPLCDREGNLETIRAIDKRVTEIMGRSCGLTPLQTHELGKAIECLGERKFYQKKGLHEIIDYLESQDRERSISTANRISPLCADDLIHDGDFMGADSLITELDLNGLNLDEQRLCVEFVLGYLYYRASKGYFRDNHLTVYLDECHNLDFSDGSIVSRYLNEGRKLGLSLILITPQAVGKGKKKDMSVLHQCGTRFYFRPLDHERREIVGHITTKEAERGKWLYHLASMKKGEFIACGILCRAGAEADMAVKLSTYMGTGQMEK